MKEYRPLGEILIAKGKITREQLETGLLARQNQKRRLGSVLISMGFLSEDDIAECLAEQYDMEIVDIARLTPDPAALSTLDGHTALTCRMLPYRLIDNVIECVIADPIDVSSMDMISRITDKRVIFRIAPISTLLDAIGRAYGLNKVDKRGAKPLRKSATRREDRSTLLDLIDTELNGNENTLVLIES